jgi:hypothetical protein
LSLVEEQEVLLLTLVILALLLLVLVDLVVRYKLVAVL